MATPVHDKYFLRSLHEEIDLFDRKLAHALKYDTFATDAERTTATNKLNSKRELLARTARQLANDGIEFKSSELPRSFRGDELATEVVSDAAPAEPEALQSATPASRLTPQRAQFGSPFAGTSLDGLATMKEYKRARTKTVAAQS